MKARSDLWSNVTRDVGRHFGRGGSKDESHIHRSREEIAITDDLRRVIRLSDMGDGPCPE